MSIAFPLNAKVRFTQKRLSILTPRDRQGLAGRIGTTQTDSSLIRKPTVCFPADGVNLALRLFRVDPSHLELVENMADTDTEIAPDHLGGENHTDIAVVATDEVTAATDDRMSQSEMDNLFD